MPRIPGPTAVMDVLQQQLEAFAALPETLASIERATRGLFVAVLSAQETALALQRVAVRADRMLTELEEPVAALAPGLVRLGRVLDDPALDTVPETLRTVSSQLVPVVATLAETQQRVARIAAATERLTSVVDEVGHGLGGLPGLGLLSRVRHAGPVAGEDPAASAAEATGAADRDAQRERARAARAAERERERARGRGSAPGDAAAS